MNKAQRPIKRFIIKAGVKLLKGDQLMIPTTRVVVVKEQEEMVMMNVSGMVGELDKQPRAEFDGRFLE